MRSSVQQLHFHRFKQVLLAISAGVCMQVWAQPPVVGAPQLVKKGSYAQLLVNKKPFIITGGELGNSSASSLEYLSPLWPKLRQMNLNTVVAPVYWDLLEPAEGRFDFALVDGLLQGARKNDLKLVLLWFGTWKNSMSCYVPEWMKINQGLFPRTQNSEGKSEEIITPFSKNALEADTRAFVKLMQHIRQVDESQKTVLMVQVENEIGMLPEARDHSALANEAFNKAVPSALIDYLQVHKDILVPEIKKLWQDNGSRTSGSWEEVFGNS
ncbi:MAG TPA: beta-galactosidase, partial [Flavisolibacter sp.]